MFGEVDTMLRSLYVALLFVPKNMPYSDMVSVNCVKIKLVRFRRYFVAESHYTLLLGCFENQHFVTK
jgi:hypothetical protein